MNIIDIARISGVSKSTVSRYLNGGSVSAKSAEKIARAIEDTGFVLNASASKLRSQHSGLVGVLVDGIEAHAVIRILRGINDGLREVDYLPFIVIDNHDEDRKLEGMQALVRQGVDGIIFGTAQLTQDHAKFLLGIEVPVIVLGQRSDTFPFAKVDDYQGGRLMAEHVLAQGPQHLLYLGFPGYDRAGLERWRGFVDTCGAAGVGVEYLECGYERDAGYAKAAEVLATGADFVVGASDTICLGIMGYLAERSLHVPEDLRLASFGDYAESSLPMVSLTSLDFDYAALGRDVARKAVDLIEGRDVPHESVGYDMRLYARRSSGVVGDHQGTIPSLAGKRRRMAANDATHNKCRTVITTDGEVDDQNSLIRALLYANEMDLAGIVLTSSMYHYAGDGNKVEPFRWTGTQWLFDTLDAYEQVYPNLCVHAKGYPEPSFLRAHTKIGNIANKGEMDEVTEGSEFLKELFLDDDPRTLYVQTWGGTNTTARALKSIEEEYSATDEWQAIQQKVYDKLVIYLILDQDESYGDYIAKAWPHLLVLNDVSNFWHFAYAWQLHADELNGTLHASWQRANVVGAEPGDKGPLMDRYALMGDGKTVEGELDEEQRGWDAYLAANPNYERYDFISEGDSPSFLYLVDTGLRSLEDPSWGGWGGRFGIGGRNSVADFDPYSGRYEASYTLTRWFDDINNDFAARVSWCTATRFEDANHAPSVSVAEGVDVVAAAGDTVTLTARGSDPDGDALTYRWWRYFEADTYEDAPAPTLEDQDMGLLIDRTAPVKDPSSLDTIALAGVDTAQVSFQVPADAKRGDTIHLIAEVRDDGTPALKRYQRVVVTVA